MVNLAEGENLDDNLTRLVRTRPLVVTSELYTFMHLSNKANVSCSPTGGAE